jgi:hypothetical protein
MLSSFVVWGFVCRKDPPGSKQKSRFWSYLLTRCLSVFEDLASRVGLMEGLVYRGREEGSEPPADIIERVWVRGSDKFKDLLWQRQVTYGQKEEAFLVGAQHRDFRKERWGLAHWSTYMLHRLHRGAR